MSVASGTCPSRATGGRLQHTLREPASVWQLPRGRFAEDRRGRITPLQLRRQVGRAAEPLPPTLRSAHRLASDQTERLTHEAPLACAAQRYHCATSSSLTDAARCVSLVVGCQSSTAVASSALPRPGLPHGALETSGRPTYLSH